MGKAKEEEGLSLTSLEVANVLRLKAVKLVLSDGVLIIEGGNEQGKSSVIQSIEMLLAGKDAKAVPEPLHGDAKKGYIVGTFGEYVVRKSYSKGKSPVLTIKSKIKGTLKSPQTMASQFLHHVSLDPLKFMAQSDREKLATLSDVMGFDSSHFDDEHRRLYEQRTAANRDVKRLRVELEACPCDETAPKEEVSVSDLMADLTKMEEANDAVRELDRQEEAHSLAILNYSSEIVRLRDELAAAEDARDKTEQRLATIREERKACVVADTDSVKQKIADADAINAAVRAKAKRAKLADSLQGAEIIADDLDGILRGVDAAREQARLAAREKLPLEDLDITEDAVLYKGKPLSQAGGSAQLRVSVAVAMGLNQDKRVKLLLIDDAEKLDAKNTKIVLKMAADAGFQVLMTRVGTGSEGSVVIEDGMLKA